MKTITIAGNIGKDATTRSTGQGDKVTGWTVAVEERNGQEKRTIWFDCSMWGKRGESLAPHLTKGAKAVVSGDLSTREHDGKTYLTIRVSDVTLMGRGQDRAQDDGETRPRSTVADTAHRAQAPSRQRAPVDDMSDEIPF